MTRNIKYKNSKQKWNLKNKERLINYRKKFYQDNKQYWIEYKEKNRNIIKLNCKKYKFNKKNAGILSIETIQLVYEDNIKQHGTLTCYLCSKPIIFGQDNIEHKNPLSRGGTNEYHNLAIAHGSKSKENCNGHKYNKTLKEFNKERKTNGRKNNN